MGSAIAIKTINEKGESMYVNLSGVEKAKVYETLAKFGVYEMETGAKPVKRETEAPKLDKNEIDKLDQASRKMKSVDDKMLKLDLNKRVDLLGQIDASTMHCCEAAEILFEDIE